MNKKVKSSMNILCATDRNFLYPAYVTIQSVIANHKGIKINFYLLAADDVTDEDKIALSQHVFSTGNSIEYLSVDEKDYENYVVSERFNKVAYFRLMAHKFLPQNMDRILYLDVDIVVDKNIYNDFYNHDFHGKYLIATSHNPNPDYSNMLDPTIVNLEAAARGEYFNSGVLLMNLKLFRRNITMDTYNEAYESCTKQGIPVFYDQGLLNYMFFDKTLYFSSMDYNFRYSIPIDYKRRLDPHKEYKRSIIHFTGMKQPYKPWDLLLEDEDVAKFGNVPFKDNYFYVSKELNDLMKIWWRYAELTPIYTELYKEMCLKRKWFKRNLLDFALKHNKLVQQMESAQKAQNNNVVVKEKIVKQLPDNFHYRTYKLACKLLSPFFAVKKLFHKRKKRG